MLDPRHLGRILLSHGVVSERQLEQAVALQEERDIALGDALVKLGLCTELEVSRAQAELAGLPFVDLDQTPPNPRALRLLSQNIALELRAVPVRIDGERLVVAACNALDFRIDAAVRRATGMQVTVAAGCPSQINRILQRYEEVKFVGACARQVATLSSSQQRVDPRLLSTSEQAHTVQMVDSYIAHAVRRGASEISFESRSDGLHVRGRIDGHMHPMAVVPRPLADAIVARVKIMSTVPLDDPGPVTGACKVRVDGNEVRFVCTAAKGTDGDVLTLRTQSAEARPVSLSELGLEDAPAEAVSRILELRRGLVIVGGPRHSGRRTTLYSLAAELARQDMKVIAVEDEVRCRLHGVTHLTARDRTGPAFAGALQTAFSQDPHVIVLSEVPDRQTAELACRAAAQGRLVLCTSYAPTSLSSLARFLDLGIAPHEVASGLSAIISQRLLRRVCKQCAEPATLSFDLNQALRARYGELDGIAFQRGRGCAQCHHIGLRGRIGIFEVLEADDDVRYLLSDRFPPSTIRKHFEDRGLRTLEEDAFEKARAGVIPPDEISQLRLGLAMPARKTGAGESLAALAEMDTSAWEIKEEAEIASWDELASLASALA